MTRTERINYLAQALKCDPEWLELSLYDNGGDFGMGDMLWHSNEDIAEQLYRFNFTHKVGDEYVRSHRDEIQTMLEAA
jgi:hypothetical protein